MQTDVILCCAPFMSVVRPSIALGTLQQLLIEHDVNARSQYLNILLANEIGLDTSERIVDSFPFHLLVGEWLFSGCLGKTPRGEMEDAYRRLIGPYLNGELPNFEDLRATAIPKFVHRAAESIVEYSPAIVGFSLMFQQTAASLAIAKAIKSLDPSIVICFGGANCYGPMGEVLLRHFEQINYVFTGEADEIFPTFVRRLLSGAPIGDLSGVIHRHSGAGNAVASPVTELDRLPIPNYDDYFGQLTLCVDADRVLPSIPFESARGCWWGQKHHCTFCGLNGREMAFRAKSSERVLTELDSLARRYKIRRFSAADNILGMRHITSVLQQLATREPGEQPGNLFYEIKSNLNEHQLEILAKAGVTWVQPGIESLSDEILRVMRKGVSALLNIRLLRNCRELGIGVIWNFLHGFPGERSESYRQMAKLPAMLEHLQPPKGCFRIRLDRFSPNFEAAEQLGFSHIAPMPAYAAVFDLPAESLYNLAYSFEGVGKPVADDASVSLLKSAIEEWWDQWYKRSATPSLHSHGVAPGMLVFDSRTVAVAPMHYLGADEALIIGHLRDPATCRDIESNGVGHLSGALVAEILQQLIAMKLVLEHDGAVISLITESERAILGHEERANFPFGYFRRN